MHRRDGVEYTCRAPLRSPYGWCVVTDLWCSARLEVTMSSNVLSPDGMAVKSKMPATARRPAPPTPTPNNPNMDD